MSESDINEKEQELAIINHAKIFKSMILPCELLGFSSRRLIKEGREWEEKRSIRWDVKFGSTMKPRAKMAEK